MDHGPTLPGSPPLTDSDRIIVHVDLDCFYAACEQQREPDLQGKPVVVGMGYTPGDTAGAVATASYEAREYGIESAQPIRTAVTTLPPAAQTDDPDGPVGYYRPVDMEYYESVAEEVRAVLRESADTLRVVSIDEAYLDVTERTGWDVAAGFGRSIRDRIRRRTGLTASVGIAPTMHAAKVASDHDKPDGLVVVEPGEVREFLAPLPIDDLHGIGPVTAEELSEQDVTTIGDLAAMPVAVLEEQYGDRGRTLHRRARGIDPRPVEPRGNPKSLSRESAFSEPTTATTTVQQRLRSLAEAVGDRAQHNGALYQTIGIKIVTPPYEIQTRERSLPGPVDAPDVLIETALELLAEFEGTPIRKVGVRVSNLSFPDGEQTALNEWQSDPKRADTGTTTDRRDRQQTLDAFDPGTGSE